VSEALIKEPLQAPLLGTVRPGPPPRVRQSRLARLLEWVGVVITAANIVALLLVEETAEAMDRTWPKLADFSRSMAASWGRAVRH
jgi:hypothetical protein